jgi:hypothetical protein
MTSIGGSLLFAARNALHPGILWLMVWPVLIALGVWLTVAVLLGAWAVAKVAGVLEHWLETALFFIEFDFADWAVVAAKVLLYVAFVPLVYLTALLIIGVFGMPAMLEHVARRAYPALGRRRGGSFTGSVWNGIAALAGLVALGMVSLPFWLVPLLWPLIPVVVLGWVNQRVLRYDALAEHADAQEMQILFRDRRGALYALGALLALVAYVPLLGFFAPVLFGLAFIHYLLGALELHRRGPLRPGGAHGGAA